LSGRIIEQGFSISLMRLFAARGSTLFINDVWYASLANNFAIYKSINPRDTSDMPDGVRSLFPYALLKSAIPD
jgi:hypothetical protein